MTKKTGLGRGLGSLISGGINASNPSAQKPATKASKATGKSSKTDRDKGGKKKNKVRAEKKSVPAVPASPALPAAADPVPAEDVQPTATGLFEIAITRIVPSPHQPRRDFHDDTLAELAESIRSEGLLQPVVVRRLDDHFELIAGERRWRACQMLKLKKIPARVIEASETSSAVLSLIENLQRENLNPVEEAMGYASLIKDFDLTQEQVAERVGRNRATVANSLRLLQLPREIQAYLIKGILSVGHAKVLLGVEDAETRLLLARQSIERGWSVRELERQVDGYRKSRERGVKVRPNVPADEQRAIADLEKQLSTSFSTRVQLRHTPKRGRIIIEYYGNDDLQRIMEQMGLH